MSFDEQPDGDIHGECAAESEPSELSAFEKWWAMLSKVPYMSKKEIAERAFYAGETASHELRFDACRPYLKEGETAADALIRMQKEITTLRNAAMQLWAGRSTFDKGNDMNLGDLFDKRDKQAEEDRKDAARYRWLRMNRLWLKANLPMLHVGEFDAAIDKARAAQEVAG